MYFQPVKVSEPIAGLFTDTETLALAEHYRRAQPIGWPYDIAIARYVSARVYELAQKEIRQAGVKIELVTFDPYKDADEMRASVRATGVLKISTLNNEFSDAAWFVPDVNLWFRAAHDLHHCQSPACNFVLEGEVCACSKMLQYFTDEPVFGQLIVGEIVSQVACVRHFGDFPEQRKILAPKWAFDRIVGAYF